MRAWLLPLVAAVAFAASATAIAQPSLAVAFEAGTAPLPRAEIVRAIGRELRAEIRQVEDDAGLPALLIVEVTGASVQLRYRTERGTIERELPYDAREPAVVVAERIALLAGNLVRDQASELAPQPPAPQPVTPAPAPAHAEPVARAPVPATQRNESPRKRPSERSQVHAFLDVAAFDSVQVHASAPRGPATVTLGLSVRFEFPVWPALAAGFGAALSHWEGTSVSNEFGDKTLIVSPTDIMDVQVWLRPRFVIGDFELSVPVSFGPSLVEQLEVDDASPPKLGFAASAQVSALYWLSGVVGLVVELGADYHHARSQEYDGRALALDLIQARVAAGVAFALL